MSEPVMRVEDLRKEFHSHGTVVRAVDGVSFEIHPGETLALVGETGCGKSTTARCILRLIDPTGGRVVFRGEDIAALSRRRFRALRRDIQMVFQDPDASLNPSMTVRQMLREPLKLYSAEGDASNERLRELMDRVRLDPALLDRRPDQLSGGQKQRIGIARAIATRPALVVLDEPTSALDMSLRVTLLGLLTHLQRDLGVAYLFITHDLSAVRQVADRVVVMYDGRVLESGAVDAVLDSPSEPYTKALISAIPVPNPNRRRRPNPGRPGDDHHSSPTAGVLMSQEANTKRVVDTLYEAYLAGDGEGMIAVMADDVEVTFLGQGTFHGIPAVRRFMAFSAGLLNDIDFRIGPVIIDGDVGCAIWHETATTHDGEPWENHGVDVIRVRDGQVVSLHENNDVRLVRQHFPPYVDPETTT